MEFVLTSKHIEMTRGASREVWFLDLREGNRLTSLCSGSRDHCLAQKEEWAGILKIDGSDAHRKLKDAGAR